MKCGCEKGEGEGGRGKTRWGGGKIKGLREGNIGEEGEDVMRSRGKGRD